jgi:HEAT repeat protein
MRRLLSLVFCAFLVSGCHRGTSSDPAALAEQYVSQLNDSTDPEVIGDLSEKLYSCGVPALDAISAALDQYDYRAKPQLIAVASRIPDTKAMWIVAKHLHDHQQAARNMACYGITLFPQAPLMNALECTRRRDDSDREWGIYALGLSDDKRRIAFLRPALKDKNSSIRALAVRAFRTIPGTETVTQAEALMRDPNDIVATEAFLTIAHLDPGSPVVIKKLIAIGENATSKEPGDKPVLTMLLGATGLPQAEPYLSKLMGDGDPRIRALAAGCYAKLGKAAKAKRLLGSLITDPDINVRLAVARAMAKLHTENVGLPLMKIALGRDPRMAFMATNALVLINQPDCIGPLMYILQKSPNLRLRRRASIGLSNMAIGKEVWPEVEQIIEMSTSRDPESRKEAAEDLALLQGPRFFVRLHDLTSDPDAEVRIAAMEGLKRQIGMKLTTPKVMTHPLPSWLED